MVCDRLICNFAITGVRMNTGIDQRSTRSLKGHVVLRGLDRFCAALIEFAEPKKVLQIPLKLDVCIPFFFPKRSLIYVGTCKVQNFYKNPAFIFNSWVL